MRKGFGRSAFRVGRWISATLLSLTGGSALLAASVKDAPGASGACASEFQIEIKGGPGGVSIHQTGAANKLRSEQRDGRTLIEIGDPGCYHKITIEKITKPN